MSEKGLPDEVTRQLELYKKIIDKALAVQLATILAGVDGMLGININEHDTLDVLVQGEYVNRADVISIIRKAVTR